MSCFCYVDSACAGDFGVVLKRGGLGDWGLGYTLWFFRHCAI